MIPADIIAKKRNGEELKTIDLSKFIKDYVSNKITDAQMSALLMAIYFNGMTDKELFTLVEEMIISGRILDFDKNTYTADKHSTGGIGDKTSIILAPVIASSGIKVPMIAGKGLEYTGGTIDKLNSIPGMNTSPPIDIFKKWVNNLGCAIISQSNTICPADNKIYQLRNQTATVPSIPIICSSIMSKKIAEGISGLVIDIKVGNGTFMKTKEHALQLSNLMKKIAIRFNLNLDIIFSNMDQPLGRYAGLGCEIQEAIQCFKGKGPKDLMQVTESLSSKLLIQSGKAKNQKEATKIFNEIIQSGKGLRMFENMVKSQGGQLDSLKNNINYKFEKTIFCSENGVINYMNTEKIGWSLVELGCGYKKPNDILDYSAGIQFLAKKGEKVSKGQPIYRVFNTNLLKLNNTIDLLKSTYTIGNEYVEDPLLL